MNDEYYKRLLEKLHKALFNRGIFEDKITVVLTKSELEDLYMLWKHKVPQEVFNKIFKKEMIIYDEAGTLPMIDNKELDKTIKDVLEKNNPLRRNLNQSRNWSKE